MLHEAVYTYVDNGISTHLAWVSSRAVADTTFLPAVLLDLAFAVIIIGLLLLSLRMTIHGAVKNAVRDVDMDVQIRKRMDKLMLSRADAAAKRFCDGE